MQRLGRKSCGGLLTLGIGCLLFITFGRPLETNGGNGHVYSPENREWVDTSKSCLDKMLCNWLELCGTAHLNSHRWIPHSNVHENGFPLERSYYNEPVDDPWLAGDEDPTSWTPEERKSRSIPQYVLDHAPYVHLFSGEQFWPCDVPEHLAHVTPYLNYTPLFEPNYRYQITNLDELNAFEDGNYGRYVYLQSDDNVEERPTWLGGAKNIPTAPDVFGYPHIFPNQQQQPITGPMQSQGRRTDQSAGPTPIPGCDTGTTNTCANFDNEQTIPSVPPSGSEPYSSRPEYDLHGTRHKPTTYGRSSAPAIRIVVPKDDGIVDAFWFFFYSYNLGQKVFNIRFGNHVGDWEHTMIRFKNGTPHSIFLSEHNFGDAFHWGAVEKYLPSSDGSGTMLSTWSNRTDDKYAKRPVIYSAVGSHAMYAAPGRHPYVLPWGLLHDQTDRGPLWDPSLNFQSFVYNRTDKRLRSSELTPLAPSAWLDYGGHWGDRFYQLSDPRQYRFAGQYHYVNGPTGPKFKNLGRTRICQSPTKPCRLREWVGEDIDRKHKFPQTALDSADGTEEGGLPGGNLTDEQDGRRTPQ